MRRRPAVMATLLTALLVLTGCNAVLPTDPVPQAGLSVDVQPAPDVQHFLEAPSPGASPTEIVQGFVRSNVGFADDDDVARMFLTPTLASEWVPTRSVLVLDGTPQYQGAGDEVTVTATVMGQIDASGVLTERTGETTQTFSLARVDGEWRIDEFPEDFGLWLTVPDLGRAFRETRIYYLDPHLSHFVPETRWLARGEGLTTAVARTQLAPVPTHLEGAVRTGASPDVHLAVGAVPVDTVSQVATVNLQGQGLGEDRQRVLDLRAQLGHALLGLGGVTAVELRLGGRNLLPDGEGAINSASELGYSDVTRETDRALLRVGEVFALVDPTFYNLRNLPSTSATRIELPRLGADWTGVAATADLEEFAAVSVDRSRLWRWRSGSEHVNEGIGDGLTDPSYDPHGDMWVAGVARSHASPRVWVVEGEQVNAVARPIEVDWLQDEQRIRTFRVSPDGTRALLVLADREGESRHRLLVAGIVRDSEGRPTGLARPRAVAPTLVAVSSARWATTSDIVVSGRRIQDQRLVPFRVPIGGWLDELGEQPGLVDVLAVPTGAGFTPVVRTEDGRFHTREGSRGWFGARNGDELIIPGT
ncbi:MtrAB system accessory lipoprotein LpqB [Ornithinimicrobium humiphilum]|uniref:Lipoprotein LpqB-like beta-propeller protein n=1 Tax=Ornithinimicrobium humiphilum TaxID=125288 RepID=A0A543KME7_9MICO|nr:LpqB family beta-propeller domain-containing protein [Ornithinimicrobium humiphilum]TQM96255.1 lipoprotein LpqB-like beta-propeller protein [Ornithinimicrobium humiphilum]